MDEQRLQLPERDPLLVPGGERLDLLVGGERPPARPSRTAAASPGRAPGGRRAPPDRSATGRPSAPAWTLPLQRSPWTRAGGSAGPASSSIRSTTRRPARAPSRRRSGRRRAPRPASSSSRARVVGGPARARRRTASSGISTPPKRSARCGEPGGRAPNAGAPAAWIVARPAAELLLPAAVEVPGLDPLERRARERRRSSTTASTSGTGSPPASREPGETRRLGPELVRRARRRGSSGRPRCRRRARAARRR